MNKAKFLLCCIMIYCESSFARDIRDNIASRDRSTNQVVISEKGVNELLWGNSEKEIDGMIGKPNGRVVWLNHSALIYGKRIAIIMFKDKFSGVLISNDLLDYATNQNITDFSKWNSTLWEIKGHIRSGDPIDTAISKDKESWKRNDYEYKFKSGNLAADPIVTSYGLSDLKIIDGVSVQNIQIDTTSIETRDWLPCDDDSKPKEIVPNIHISTKDINGIPWGITEDDAMKLLGNPNGYLAMDKKTELLYGKLTALKFDNGKFREICFSDANIETRLSSHFQNSSILNEEIWELNGLFKFGDNIKQLKDANPENWKSGNDFENNEFKVSIQIMSSSTGSETINGACITKK